MQIAKTYVIEHLRRTIGSWRQVEGGLSLLRTFQKLIPCSVEMLRLEIKQPTGALPLKSNFLTEVEEYFSGIWSASTNKIKSFKLLQLFFLFL